MLSAVIRCAAVAALLASSGLTLAFQFAPASAWWVELLRYVPYAAYLLPTLLLFALSLRLTIQWRVVAGAAVLLTLTGVMGLSTGSGEPGSEPLRVMTYNIKSYVAEENGQGYGPIVDEVQRHRPDVLVMQDAQEINDAPGGVPAAFQTLLAGREVFRHGQYVVVSRYPLRNCRVEDIAVAREATTYVQCTVGTPVGDVELVTVHFISPRRGLNATRHERLDGLDEWRLNVAQRLSQSERLAANLARQAPDRPLIVAGDLNAPEASSVVRTLLTLGLRDAYSAASVGWGHTHGHSLRPHISFLRIDHILVSRRLAVHRCFVGGSEGSEHRPVVADLWLRPAS